MFATLGSLREALSALVDSAAAISLARSSHSYSRPKTLTVLMLPMSSSSKSWEYIR